MPAPSSTTTTTGITRASFTVFSQFFIIFTPLFLPWRKRPPPCPPQSRDIASVPASYGRRIWKSAQLTCFPKIPMMEDGNLRHD